MKPVKASLHGAKRRIYHIPQFRYLRRSNASSANSIVVVNLYDSGRTSDRRHCAGNIPDHNRSATDDGIVADTDLFNDSRTDPDTTPFSDSNGPGYGTSPAAMRTSADHAVMRNVCQIVDDTEIADPAGRIDIGHRTDISTATDLRRDCVDCRQANTKLQENKSLCCRSHKLHRNWYRAVRLENRLTVCRFAISHTTCYISGNSRDPRTSLPGGKGGPMDAAELHILNGDAALELWKRCGFRGQSLVWRETYLEGPLPDTDDLDVFREARAEYLSHFAELSGIDRSRLSRHLLKMEEALRAAP